MELEEIINLKKNANEIRKNLLLAIHSVQTGHPGTSLSMIEILTVLYMKYLRINKTDSKDIDRDFFILSKGHGAPGLYSTLAQVGLIPKAELYTLRKLGSRLQGHPNSDYLPWVEFSTGSLGQGISVSVGIALGLKLERKPNRVFCILGDGELQEGQNWEAAMSAAFLQLGGLTVIVDKNNLQSDGETAKIMDLGDLASKWEAFGWHVASVDGHDFRSLDMAISKALLVHDKPSVIIANTVKGKGVSFMEGSPKWHHHPISDQEIDIAIKELENENY